MYNARSERVTRLFHALLADVGIAEKREKIKMSDDEILPTTRKNRHKSNYDIHSLRHTFVWLAAEARIATHAKRQDIKKAMSGFNSLGDPEQ